VKEGNSKKGIAVDLDWIISLGLFLIYLGIFFIAIRQIPSQASPTSALLDGLASHITTDTAWSVEELPLVVFSNVSGSEPIIIRFPYSWKNFSFKDQLYFEMKDGRLMFIKELGEGRNLLELVHSGENYSLAAPLLELQANRVSATVNSKRFQAEFQDSMLSRANHYDSERLGNLNIQLSSTELSFRKAESSITPLSASYTAEFEELNHTSVIIAGYPRIINFIDTDQQQPHNFSMAMTVRNYSRYFVNGLLHQIDYSKDGCAYATSNFLDFSDDLSGAGFVFPEQANIKICTSNSLVSLQADFPVEREARYDIIFHQGDYTNAIAYSAPYRTRFGVALNITGASMRLLSGLNNTNYEDLKKAWGYPAKREFQFVVINQSGSSPFNYSSASPGISNVYAKESDIFILDKYGDRTRNTLRVRGW
jgi:hypothetical protein